MEKFNLEDLGTEEPVVLTLEYGGKEMGVSARGELLFIAAPRGNFKSTVVKNLLVGAQVAQVVSAIYKKGPSIIESMVLFLKDWMQKHNYETIDQFRGNLSQKNIKQPAMFERSQFMRYFSDAGY